MLGLLVLFGILSTIWYASLSLGPSRWPPVGSRLWTRIHGHYRWKLFWIAYKSRVSLTVIYLRLAFSQGHNTAIQVEIQCPLHFELALGRSSVVLEYAFIELTVSSLPALEQRGTVLLEMTSHFCRTYPLGLRLSNVPPWSHSPCLVSYYLRYRLIESFYVDQSEINSKLGSIAIKVVVIFACRW